MFPVRLTFFITVLPMPAARLTSSDGTEMFPFAVVFLLSDLLPSDVTCGFVTRFLVVSDSVFVVTFSGFVVSDFVVVCSGFVVSLSFLVVTFSCFVVTLG